MWEQAPQRPTERPGSERGSFFHCEKRDISTTLVVLHKHHRTLSCRKVRHPSLASSGHYPIEDQCNRCRYRYWYLGFAGPSRGIMLMRLKAALFAFQQPLTSSTVFGLAMEDFHTPRWLTAWKAKRPSIASADRSVTLLLICDSLSRQFSAKSHGPMILKSSRCHGDMMKRLLSRKRFPLGV